jgi:hypothetical protein
VWARYGFDATPQQKDKVYNTMQQIFSIWTKGTGSLPVARPKTMNDIALMKIPVKKLPHIAFNTGKYPFIKKYLLNENFYDTGGNFLIGKMMFINMPELGWHGHPDLEWHGQMLLDPKSHTRKQAEVYLTERGNPNSFSYFTFAASGAVVGIAKNRIEAFTQSRLWSYGTTILGTVVASQVFKPQQREILAGGAVGIIGEEIVKWYRNRNRK